MEQCLERCPTGLHALRRSSILASCFKEFATLRPNCSFQAPTRARHRCIRREPRWRGLTRYRNAALPSGFRLWLTDDGSLTEHLVASGRGPFAVQRQYQGWEVPLPSERALLGLPPRQLALIREVALLLGGMPVVFARSVFPLASLSGKLAHLRRLQNKSLGAILFRHPGMHRCPFELARMAGDCDYLPAQLHQSEPAWGRRCRFEINGKPLMVSEVFLQPFIPWPAVLSVHRSQRGRVNAAIVAPSQ